MRQRTASGPKLFPEVLPEASRIPLQALVGVLPRSEWLPHPAKTRELAYANVMAGYRKHNVNPFSVPVIIDLGSSPDFASSAARYSPTLTRTRAGGAGYWCSTKGGKVSVDELAKLQGFLGPLLSVDWKGKISKGAFGGMIGNAQSANILLRLYPNVLYHAKLITLEEHTRMLEGIAKHWRAISQADFSSDSDSS